MWLEGGLKSVHFLIDDIIQDVSVCQSVLPHETHKTEKAQPRVIVGSHGHKQYHPDAEIKNIPEIQ